MRVGTFRYQPTPALAGAQPSAASRAPRRRGRRMTIAKRTYLTFALAALTGLGGSAVTLTSAPASAAGHEEHDVALYVSSDDTDSVLAYDGETGDLEKK